MNRIGTGRYHRMTAILYAMIALGQSALTGFMSGWLIYFYLPPNGNPLVPFGLFGIAVLISRIAHILTVLLVNRLPLRAISKQWIYLVGGGFLMPIWFVLLWILPQASESTWNLVYLFLVLVAFNISAGVHQAIYENLFTRLSFAEDGQGVVSEWRVGFMLGGSLLVGWVGPLIQALGYIQSAWIFAGVSAPFLVLPGWLLRRRLEQETQPFKRILFSDAIVGAWGQPAFRIFVISWSLLWLATTLTFETLPYIVTEICRLDKAYTAWFYFSGLLVSLAGYPVATKLAKFYGVKTIYRISLLVGAVAISMLALVGDGIPLPLFVQGLVWMILQAVCLAGAQALPTAVVAEITVDTPNWQGPLYAFGNLVDQLSSGLGLTLIPFFLLLGHSSLNPGGPLGVRLLAIAGGIVLIVSFGVFGHYKINKYDSN